jgi:hypothetical protein
MTRSPDERAKRKLRLIFQRAKQLVEQAEKEKNISPNKKRSKPVRNERAVIFVPPCRDWYVKARPTVEACQEWYEPLRWETF